MGEDPCKPLLETARTEFLAYRNLGKTVRTTRCIYGAVTNRDLNRPVSGTYFYTQQFEVGPLDAVLYRGVYASARVTDLVQNTRCVKLSLPRAAIAFLGRRAIFDS